MSSLSTVTRLRVQRVLQGFYDVALRKEAERRAEAEATMQVIEPVCLTYALSPRKSSSNFSRVALRSPTIISASGS